ncbi:sigma factor-like helix-turn-helix DNA-binding protein [Arachidicoccus sp.]|uniref:sigma factor-like helix-turn-helix DNA-binding protein n=1 Tax=Arachidicoccus sp. TaxID=1872624 RepID=UPI003D215B65
MGQANLVEIASLSAYLATAVKFSVFAFLQKELKRKNILQKITNAPVAYSDEAAIYARFFKTYIEEAVLLLPEKCRIVYRYSREQDLSVKEIAPEMQVAHKTGENHLFRALQTLRVILRSAYHTPALIFILHFLRTLYLS